MGLPILLTNKNLTSDNFKSATSEFDEFIDQPVKGANNTGSLTLVSSGNYFGTAAANIKVQIKTAGDTGVSRFIFSDDGGTTYFGKNQVPVFEDFEVIEETI